MSCCACFCFVFRTFVIYLLKVVGFSGTETQKCQPCPLTCWLNSVWFDCPRLCKCKATSRAWASPASLAHKVINPSRPINQAMNSVSNFDLAPGFSCSLFALIQRFMSHTGFTLHLHSRVSCFLPWSVFVWWCFVLVCCLLFGTSCKRLFQKQHKLTYAFPAWTAAPPVQKNTRNWCLGNRASKDWTKLIVKHLLRGLFWSCSTSKEVSWFTCPSNDKNWEFEMCPWNNNCLWL